MCSTAQHGRRPSPVKYATAGPQRPDSTRRRRAESPDSTGFRRSRIRCPLPIMPPAPPLPRVSAGTSPAAHRLHTRSGDLVFAPRPRFLHCRVSSVIVIQTPSCPRRPRAHHNLQVVDGFAHVVHSNKAAPWPRLALRNARGIPVTSPGNSPTRFARQPAITGKPSPPRASSQQSRLCSSVCRANREPRLMRARSMPAQAPRSCEQKSQLRDDIARPSRLHRSRIACMCRTYATRLSQASSRRARAARNVVDHAAPA